MFQVTTLDLDNLPRAEDGRIDYSSDFFGKETNLTVSGQLEGETFAMAFRNIYTFRTYFQGRKLQHRKARIRVLDDRAGDRFCRP